MSETTFIVTADLDDQSSHWLNDLRQKHFPPARNYLDAHLTIFHKLDEASIQSVKRIVGAQVYEAIELRFIGVRMLGRGVAIDVDAPRLLALRSALTSALEEILTPQDRQSFRPHVTIQNKVDPEVAKNLHAELRAGFVPRTGSTNALMVWQYLGGPWQFIEKLSFWKSRGA